VLVSRQFVDMSRIRIEGLLAAFPKLIGIGKQHTYVETENVRYVYQPIEALYLLLVTNKQSNILDDLETLRLLSKLVFISYICLCFFFLAVSYSYIGTLNCSILYNGFSGIWLASGYPPSFCAPMVISDMFLYLVMFVLFLLDLKNFES